METLILIAIFLGLVLLGVKLKGISDDIDKAIVELDKLKEKEKEKEEKELKTKLDSTYTPIPKSREEVFGAEKRYNPNEIKGMFDSVFEEENEPK